MTMTDVGTAAASGASPPPSPEQTSDSPQPGLEAPQTFDDMGLREEVRTALAEMGYTAPMPVQAQSFRAIMNGRDLMVQSRTGSGKTAAFAIPFAQGLIDPARGEVQALCLSPTRELALQIAAECTKIGKHRKLQIVPVYGGAPMGRQVDQLSAGAHIVVGTPGRVLDHLRRGTLSLDRLRALVLDECDEMLSMGFAEELQAILERCPSERQTLLFSATIPEEIERISKKYMRGAEKLTLSADFVGVQEIKHAFYLVSGMGRPRDLLRVLEVERPDSAIVFCNTREETSLVAEALRREGLDAEAISSDLTQKDRERVMGRMRSGNLHYLVATDVAARGIDISALSHVINYTFPESAEVYIHRTGRTGRAGRSGVAISLISPRELGNFYYLKLTYKIRPEERSLPSDEELTSRREGKRVAELVRELGTRNVSAEWRSLARRIWSSEGGETIVAGLLEHYFGHRTNEAPPKHPHGGAGRSRPAAATAPPATLPDTQPPAITAPPPTDSAPKPTPPQVAPQPLAPIASVTASNVNEAEHSRSESRRGRDTRSPRPQRERRSPAAAPVPSSTPARTRHPRSTPAPTTPGEATAAAGAIGNTAADKEFWETWIDQQHNEKQEPPAPRSTAEPSPTRHRTGGAHVEEPAGMVRLYVNLGRRDRVNTEDLDRFLGDLGLKYSALRVFGSHTYFYVDEASVAHTIETLSRSRYGERNLVCERSHR